MTIWGYLIVGLIYAVNGLLVDISSTDPMKVWTRIAFAVMAGLLWPLSLILHIGLAVWCRVKPEHRISIEIVEKKN